jgi:uncharacterized protein YqeY
MTNLIEQINADLKDAMRAKNKVKLGALRLITAAIKQIEVDERIVVDDARLLAILDKMAKQRNESIHQFNLAGRTDLVDQEEFELTIINQYLPEPLSENEVKQLIEKTLIDSHATQLSDMGKVMAILKPLLQGRADMAKVSAILKTKLTS